MKENAKYMFSGRPKTCLFFFFFWIRVKMLSSFARDELPSRTSTQIEKTYSAESCQVHTRKMLHHCNTRSAMYVWQTLDTRSPCRFLWTSYFNVSFLLKVTLYSPQLPLTRRYQIYKTGEDEQKQGYSLQRLPHGLCRRFFRR